MLQIKANETIKLKAMGSWPETIHVFEEKSIWAVNAALTAERPLLIRGEPGAGKSQLARAAAIALDRAFIADVVHARSECHELQYHFDAVLRLGEAQALGVCGSQSDVREVLSPKGFLSPASLWWAFNWQTAKEQAALCRYAAPVPERPEGWTEEKGCVVLIDEIDKADSDLPNGLLETLGNGAFTVPYLEKAVRLAKNTAPPLVIITTNEERELPAAFLRRCLVFNMELPLEEHDFINWLVERGEVHFGEKCSREVREIAAEQLWLDRVMALQHNLQVPGQAEYLDLLRALSKLSNTKEGQLIALEQISDFALKKHRTEIV
jgi:MoxR-like ATPase